jgi:hypothetical protein
MSTSNDIELYSYSDHGYWSGGHYGKFLRPDAWSFLDRFGNKKHTSAFLCLVPSCTSSLQKHMLKVEYLGVIFHSGKHHPI